MCVAVVIVAGVGPQPAFVVANVIVSKPQTNRCCVGE